MKFYFFDTSAVVKRYHSEKGTEAIDRIFAENDRAIAISSVSLTETVSALNKKKEEKTISKEDLDIALSRFFHDAIKDFLILEIDDRLTPACSCPQLEGAKAGFCLCRQKACLGCRKGRLGNH